jgi:hypothetical protein
MHYKTWPKRSRMHCVNPLTFLSYHEIFHQHRFNWGCASLCKCVACRQGKLGICFFRISVLTTRHGSFPTGQRRHNGRICEWSGLVLGTQRRGKDENGYLHSTGLCDCRMDYTCRSRLGTADTLVGSQRRGKRIKLTALFSWLADEGFEQLRETLIRCTMCQMTCFIFDEPEGETSSWLMVTIPVL